MYFSHFKHPELDKTQKPSDMETHCENEKKTSWFKLINLVRFCHNSPWKFRSSTKKILQFITVSGLKAYQKRISKAPEKMKNMLGYTEPVSRQALQSTRIKKLIENFFHARKTFPRSLFYILINGFANTLDITVILQKHSSLLTFFRRQLSNGGTRNKVGISICWSVSIPTPTKNASDSGNSSAQFCFFCVDSCSSGCLWRSSQHFFDGMIFYSSIFGLSSSRPLLLWCNFKNRFFTSTKHYLN